MLEPLGFRRKLSKKPKATNYPDGQEFIHRGTFETSDESLSEDESDSEILKEQPYSMLCALNERVPESTIITAAKAPICVLAKGHECIPGHALIDSGALHTNYIGENFFNNLRGKISEYSIKPANGVVTFADGKTSAKITKCVELEMTLLSPKGEKFYLKDRFMVLKSREDIIIGLPTIIKKLLPLFVDMLYSVDPELIRSESFKPEASINAIIENPWSILEEMSPEEEDTLMPCAFPDALHYLSMTHDSAVQEYHSLLDSHIHPDFAKYGKENPDKDIRKLLGSQLGVSVFVPTDWTGVKIEPLHIKFREGLPARYKPPARPINPRLYENAKKEFERLQTYFYEPSDSPIASPLVVAFKATPPYLRFCGDYSTKVNPHIETGQYPIPHVFHSLEKISKYKVFLDFDLTNGFHQFPLDEATSRMLSIQTPWGQYQPRFLPEGVPVGSFVLQEAMYNIFKEFEEFCIIIFDNLLVLANDFEDAYNKTKLILEKCKKMNLVLKMKKSWLGFPKVNFFGYTCEFQKFYLSDERKQGVASMPMPTSTTQMRRFLGCSAFFQKFVPNFSERTHLLTNMVKKDFDWNRKNWTEDYEGAFNSFKSALLEACELFYPDYDLDWILRADASDYGVGFVLLQVAKHLDDEVLQPLVFGSQKFSEQAKKWSTYAKEAYAMFFSMKACEYYLRAKPFTFEGDHANLRWMEQCTEAKVIRWRIYMQTFTYKFNHIAGKANMVADWQSRFNLIKIRFVDDESVPVYSALQSLVHCLDDNPQDLNVVTRSKNYDQTDGNINVDNSVVERDPVASDNTVTMTKQEMFNAVHGARQGHHGVVTTYRLLCERFAKHGCSVEDVAHFVSACPVCAVTSKNRETKLHPVTRNLKVPAPRTMIGIDYLEIGLDNFGNKGVYVIKDHFSLLTYIYPTAEKDVSNAALAIFSFCVLYGKTGGIISDPGSEFTSSGLEQLNNWFGIEQRFSLVDRHESNGVENTNRQILRRLREICTESDIEQYKASINDAYKALLSSNDVRSRWSSPHIIYWVSFLINKLSIFETGFSPYELTFGTKANQYFDFPAGPLDKNSAHKYIRILSDDLEYLQGQCENFQKKIVEKRQRKDGVLNTLQRGDFVLRDIPPDHKRPSKLHGPYRGPYVVRGQNKNDVQIRHLATNKLDTEYIGRLSLFFGSLESATAAAFADSDQHMVREIMAYQGNPMVRSSMQFYVLFSDNERVWVPYSLDLFNSEPYTYFCKARPELRPLLSHATEAAKWCRMIKLKPILHFKPGMQIYLDIRVFGAEWYQTLSLPDLHTKTYIVSCQLGNWETLGKAIHLECTMLSRKLVINNLFIQLHCYRKKFDPNSGEILVTPQLIKDHPSLLVRRLLSADDYAYLAGKRFTDEGITYVVTRVTVDKQQNIVAFVRPQLARSRTIAAEDPRPYHVQAVVDLLGQSSPQEGVV